MTTAVFPFEHASSSSERKKNCCFKSSWGKECLRWRKELSSELTQYLAQRLLPIQQHNLSLQSRNCLFLRFDCLLKCGDQLFGN